MLFFAITLTNVLEDKPAENLDELLVEISKGNNTAFEKLYIETKSSVYGYALSLLKDSHKAEDVLQDTYVKIMTASHLYTPGTKPIAWILTITRNLCLMKFRENNRYGEMPEYEEVAVESHEAHFENKMVLNAAMKVLSSEESSIVVMHCVTGLKHREIAEIMSLPLSTVLSKYNRALKKLREELKEVIL